MSDDINKIIADAALSKMKFIMEHKEEYLEAWIAKTGVDPSEAILIQQEKDGVTKIWAEKKPKICSMCQRPY